MISDLLVHTYCAPESQASWQMRLRRLRSEILEGMGERCPQTESKKYLDSLDK